MCAERHNSKFAHYQVPLKIIFGVLMAAANVEKVLLQSLVAQQYTTASFRLVMGRERDFIVPPLKDRSGSGTPALIKLGRISRELKFTASYELNGKFPSGFGDNPVLTERYTADDVFLVASGLIAAAPELSTDHAIKLAVWMLQRLRKAEEYETAITSRA